jgi:hypothetical protein
MSDLDLTKKTNSSQNQNTGSQNLKDQVVDAGAEMKARWRRLASVDRYGARQVQGSGRRRWDMASGLRTIFRTVHEQQRSGADFVERFAGNIRDAARA